MEIASTDYVFKGADKKQAKDLYDKIESLKQMKKPLVENPWEKPLGDKLYLGCLINLFGGDCKKMFCDGAVKSFKLNQNTVIMSCATVYYEAAEFRHFIERQYPGSKIYYLVRDGYDRFFTNDRNGEFFKGQYYVFYEGDAEYCETIEKAAEFFGNAYGKKIRPNYGEISKEVDNRNNNGDGYGEFVKIEVRND
jgi:hypothetical protein